MAEGDARAVRIDLLRVEAQLLDDRAGLGGEGLVGLDHVQIGDAQAGALEGQLGRRHRADAHVQRVDAGHGVRHQARHRLEAATLGSGALHQHHGGGAIVEAGSVAGGHAAVVALEGRLELAQLLEGQVVAHVLIGVEHHFAAASLQGDRQDLLLEAAFLDGHGGAAMGFQRQRVLGLAGDVVGAAHVLGGDAHVHLVHRVGEGADHHVDHAGVAHARAEAHRRGGVGRAAHAVGTAGDGDLGIAEQDALGGADDGLQARTAQAVDGQGGGLLADAALQGDDARDVHVDRFGMDDVAEHHLVDFVAVHLGTLQGFAGDHGAQVAGGEVLQAAAEIADGSTGTADDDYFTLTHGRYPLFKAEIG
ncbi:hypothetical protein D3C85_893340 [compost metagenome]